MLEIYCGDVRLNLPDDIQINFIIENPLMLSDKIPVPYALSFNVPPTLLNLQTFGFPNRVNAFKSKEFTNAKIVFDGVVFSKGMLVLEGFENSLVLSYKGVDVFNALRSKLYETEMEEFKPGTAFKDTGRPGNKWLIDRNNTTNFAYKYRLIAPEVATIHPKYVMAPIRVAGTEFQVLQKTIMQQSPPVTFNVDLKLCQVSADSMYINFFNAGQKDWNLTRQHQPRGTGIRDYVNTRFFPMPYLHYVFDKVFDDLLVENVFNEEDLNKLILVTSFHPQYTRVDRDLYSEPFRGMFFDNMEGKTSNFNPVLKLKSYMPDVQINDFLKEIMKLFCLSLYPYMGKFKLLKNKDILAATERENWTAKKIDKLQLRTRKGVFYKYGYEDVEDELVSVDVTNQLTTIQELLTAPVDESANFTENFHISTTGETYAKELDEDGVIYTRLNSGFGRNGATKLDEQEEFDVVSNISPLPMAIEKYWVDKGANAAAYPAMRNWYVPIFNGDRFSRPTNLHVMLYSGYYKVDNNTTDKYPLITPYNYDHQGVKHGNLSLGWEGEDGLLNRFHAEYKLWLEKDKLFASGVFLLTALDLKSLKLDIKKSIDGKDFMIGKVQVTITKTQIKPALVDLIEV